MDALLMQISAGDVGATLIAFVLGVCLAVIVQQMIAKTRAKYLEAYERITGQRLKPS